MGSRDEILAAIRKHEPPATELPHVDRDWTTYPDRLLQLATVLSAIGGLFIRAADAAQADRQLRELAVYRDAKQIVSTVSGIGQSTVDLASISDPHQLETVDFAVLP